MADRRSLDESTPLLAGGRGVATSTAEVPVPSPHDDLDARFKRWVDGVAQKMAKAAGRRRGSARPEPDYLVSVFYPKQADPSPRSDVHAQLGRRHGDRSRFEGALSPEDMDICVSQAKDAVAAGIYPKMISTGSSGSYFVRTRDLAASTSAQHIEMPPSARPDMRVVPPNSSGQGPKERLTTMAVFKPKDEEPYGNLNPKRVFLRKYFWWAMGRPCLIPNFSYLSEVGSSILDERLGLELVPRTALVSLASPTFHYRYQDRLAWETNGKPLPEKIGSFQIFLHGYTNASDFLRAHPWPSRPRSMLERDLLAEQRAHRLSRRKEKARLRNCYVSLKHLVLCRHGFELSQEEGAGTSTSDEDDEADGGDGVEEGFVWTPHLKRSFRLELEKLVCFDFLQRNTDRGLDNFMLKLDHDAEGRTIVKLGAIDNSLSFPWKHPVGIRSYPFGWLYLPADLVGGPFSDETRELFVPRLSDATWWLQTSARLRELFERDEHYSAKLFERQMEVMKGQGWNLLESLRNRDEGPLELCARMKQLVLTETVDTVMEDVAQMKGAKVALRSSAPPLPLQPPSPPPLPQLTSVQTAQVEAKQDSASAASHAGSKPIPTPRTQSAQSAATPDEAALPRSLPEAGQVWPPAPRYPGQLGIDVLDEFNRLARRARRPALRKHRTAAASSRGHSRNASLRASYASEDDEEGAERDSTGRAAAAAAASAARPASRSPARARAAAASSHARPARASQGTSIDALVTTTDGGPVAQTMDGPAPPPPSAGPGDDADGGVRADGDEEAKRARSDSMGGASTAGTAMLASLPALPPREADAAPDASSADRAAEAASRTLRRNESRRRRVGSVGGAAASSSSSSSSSSSWGWRREGKASRRSRSETASSLFGAMTGAGAGGNDGRGGAATWGERQVRVLVEHLEADQGVAWQTWLGLQ